MTWIVDRFAVTVGVWPLRLYEEEDPPHRNIPLLLQLFKALLLLICVVFLPGVSTVTVNLTIVSDTVSPNRTVVLKTNR